MTTEQTTRKRIDPPVRPDGRCAVCPKMRHPERSKKYGLEAAQLDPFCSTACCRAYYGIPLDGRPDEEEAKFA